MCCVSSLIELIIIVFTGKWVKVDIEVLENLMEIKMPLFLRKCKDYVNIRCYSVAVKINSKDMMYL